MDSCMAGVGVDELSGVAGPFPGLWRGQHGRAKKQREQELV